MPSSKRVGVKERGGSERLKRKKGRKRGKARQNRSVKDAIAVDCWWTHVLSLKYRLLDCGWRCRFQREQRLATGIEMKEQKRRRPIIQRAQVGDDSVFIVVKACRKRRILWHKPAGPGERAGDFVIFDFDHQIWRWATYVLVLLLRHLFLAAAVDCLVGNKIWISCLRAVRRSLGKQIPK